MLNIPGLHTLCANERVAFGARVRARVRVRVRVQACINSTFEPTIEYQRWFSGLFTSEL